ncbi:hypothetical protein [Sphingomonas quercus]|uniref:Uncharacterized protein n=1 Tax=Sphingomonas quercus TaxID=2842451 RepID=A0ABS6BIC2_9SPHN|nr:hypothetical protein [Sphingomonas quercus]MBU3077561.1 hypothetical protein [Sphingomonas quercus]
MPKSAIVPFLLTKDEEGNFRITIRSTRYNSQNYPLVTSTMQPQTFKTATAARAHAKEHFGAQAGEFATK